MPDIDIDFKDRQQILSLLNHRVAKLHNGKKHNTGVYPTEIPHDPVSGIATIDYKTADDRGYFKLDFLNVSVYNDVRDEEHLVDLINRQPIWELLLHKEFVDQLFHLHGHDAVLKQTKPNSLEKLAAVLAMIRPAKRYLINKPWEDIFNEVWTKPQSDQYYFKKSHAFSYAMAVVVHMNLLCEKFTEASA